MAPRVWIDGDACPREVKDVIFRAAERLQVHTTLVANSNVFVPRSRFIAMLQVKGGADVADDRIALEASAGDIAITEDVPLAARLVPNGVVVINTHGEVIDADNVGERLSVRDFMTELRDVGVTTAGPRPFSARDKQRFASALDAALTRALRRG